MGILKTIISVFCTGIATAGLASGAFAAVVQENYLTGYAVSGGTTLEDQLRRSPSAPVSYSGTKMSGVADYGVLKAKTSASASGLGNIGNTGMTVRTGYSAKVEAAPGAVGLGGGLLTGDRVSLNVSFRVDGTAQSSSSSGGLGTSDFSSSLTIIDENNRIDFPACKDFPDGCFVPRLVDFTGHANSYSSGGSVYNDGGWDWDLKAKSALDVVTDHRSDSSSGGSAFAHLNTGILSTTIDTTIGATLDIMASLSLLSQAYDGAYSSIDFFNTFGFFLTPITEGAALTYTGITPAANFLTAVPIPAALWLFGSGLLGLIGVARRKARV